MESSNVADILERAADRLSKPGAWLSGHPLALNDKGQELRSRDIDQAVCYCMAGSVWAAANDFRNSGLVWRAFDAIRPVIGEFSIGGWNSREGRTQAEVVAKLREAATHARGNQS